MTLMTYWESDEGLRRLAMFTDRVATYEAACPGWAKSWQALTEAIGGIVCPPLFHPGDGYLTHLESAKGELDMILVPHGFLLAPSRVKFLRGQPVSCHQNAARIYLGQVWKKANADGVGTGYALSNDGLWREHSWAMAGDVLIETTVRRDAYWGIVYRDTAATQWASLMLDNSGGNPTGI